MTIDIDQIVERAIERANEKWIERLPELIRKALDQRDEKLQSLSAILDISPKAASARLARDPELRKLGVQIGTRSLPLFLKSVVENYYRAKAAR